MRRPVPFVLVLAGLAAGACRAKPPVPPPTPAGVNQDSINRARAAEQARRDSIARAQSRADSIARAQAAAEQARRDAEAASARVAAARASLTQAVYFDYDRSELSADTRRVLDAKAALLRANPGLRLRVSGHADDRGSDEYNLALGQRRAEAVKQYFVQAGIDGGRIATVSYGEERPAMSGENEQAWSKNRRDEFEITAGGDNLTVPR